MDSKGTLLSEKKPISKGYIPHNSVYKASLKWQKYRAGEQMNGWGVGGGNRGGCGYKPAAKGILEVMGCPVSWLWSWLHKSTRGGKLQTQLQMSACKSGEIGVRRVNCIDVNFLVLHCNLSSGRCYHWGERDEGHLRSLCYFFQLRVNLWYLKFRSLIKIFPCQRKIKADLSQKTLDRVGNTWATLKLYIW